jgi:tripartite-type tricarboxylate transporter receptor subunit TctC
VPFPPGGLTDVLGRMVGERLRKTLNQAVVVENKPGAGTLLGAGVVAKSPPDGYTLMVATSTTLGISPFLYENTPFKIGDLTGVAMLGDVTLLLVTRPDFRPRTRPSWSPRCARSRAATTSHRRAAAPCTTC